MSCRRVVSHLTLFSVQPRFRDLILKLVATTDEIIIGHSRNISASSEAQRSQLRMSPVTLAWSVSQRVSLDINVQAAIECVTSFLPLNHFSNTIRQSWAKPWVDYVFHTIKDNSTRLLCTHRILASAWVQWRLYWTNPSKLRWSYSFGHRWSLEPPW